MAVPNSTKFHGLGLDAFFLVQKLNSMHYYEVQEIVEDLIIKNGLWEELVYYARGKFMLMHKE